MSMTRIPCFASRRRRRQRVIRKNARMEIIEEPMMENVTTRAKRSLLSAIVRTVWTVAVAWDFTFY